MKRPIIVLLLLLSIAGSTNAQAIGFSIATDFGLQRSFKKEQRFWAAGHTVQAQFHFAPRDVLYLSICYYTEGKFSNQLTATAKSALTIPQSQPYRNDAAMRFKQFSVGFKKYLKGRFDTELGWNLYALGGFGLVFGRVINTHSPSVDTADYDVPVRPGKANFKRLTLDLGGGVEFPVGGDVFLYTEGKVWIPTTDYPSRYIFVNDNAPFAGMLNVGIRILF